jgi:Fic family protein
MEIKYQLNQNIINYIAEFSSLHGKLQIGSRLIDNTILQYINKLNNRVSTFAAACMDCPSHPQYLDKIANSEIANVINDKGQIRYFESFLDTLQNIDKYFDSYLNISLDTIHNIAKSINPDGSSAQIRTKERILTFQEIKEGTISKTQRQVQTSPNKIKKLLQDYIDWIKAYSHSVHPLLLSAITHIKLAEIHPFEDGNGRLSRMMARGLLKIGDIDNDMILDFNSYYYLNRTKYFDLIGSCIQKQDITEWIEFFLLGAIETISKTMNQIHGLTGGTIDILNNQIQILTPREQRMVSIIYINGNSSGTEIARELGVSRQNTHVVLNKLEKLGIIKKYGQNTGIRYTIN